MSDGTNGKKWYYAENKERKGPFSQEQMVDLVQKGTITGTTLIWTQGFDKWRKAADTEMADHLQTVQPNDDLPPLPTKMSSIIDAVSNLKTNEKVSSVIDAVSELNVKEKVSSVVGAVSNLKTNEKVSSVIDAVSELNVKEKVSSVVDSVSNLKTNEKVTSALGSVSDIKYKVVSSKSFQNKRLRFAAGFFVLCVVVIVLAGLVYGGAQSGFEFEVYHDREFGIQYSIVKGSEGELKELLPGIKLRQFTWKSDDGASSLLYTISRNNDNWDEQKRLDHAIHLVTEYIANELFGTPLGRVTNKTSSPNYVFAEGAFDDGKRKFSSQTIFEGHNLDIVGTFQKGSEKKFSQVRTTFEQSIAAASNTGGTSGNTQQGGSGAAQEVSREAQNAIDNELDKTATLFDVVSIKLPSTWDYSTEYVDESSIGMLHIDCKNEKIRIGVRCADDFYNFPGEYKVEDFTFADGTTGYYAKNNEDGVIVFAFTDENEIFETSFSVNYYSESDWFAQNEELIYAIARTLSYEETYDDYYIAGDNQEQINDQGDSSVQGDTSGIPLPTLGFSLDTFITNFHNAEASLGGSFLTIRDVSDFVLVEKGKIFSTYESRTSYTRDNAISGRIRVIVRVRDDYVASVMFVNTGTPNRDVFGNLSEVNLFRITGERLILLCSVIPDFPLEELALNAIYDPVYLYENYIFRTSFSENGESVFQINRVHETSSLP